MNGFCVGFQDPLPFDCTVVAVNKTTGPDGAVPSYGDDVLEAHSKSDALLGHHFLPHVFLLYSRRPGKVCPCHSFFFSTRVAISLTEF